ncbi:SDR family oxidoreductase [Bradyrhizobium sp. 200]|uniref:SDR family NAD(P)-dependent oxidoreductase n=1 Tax=Bradyrhizobium sp. 200 TaxID=2782665 RepID=UPI001FFE9703|nr:SDR family oxidoreductase [Bradyrhizobium sp. 200]UPJ49043.1 SDR family oxidoreductase [Bradyrhizobium sp. 200]
MGSLRGKVVIVIGVDRGFGRDLALFVAERGASVIVNPCASNGSTSPLANDIAFEIAELGAEAAVVAESACTSVGASRVVEAALDSFGRVDVLMNNASNLVDQTYAEDELRSEVGPPRTCFDHVVRAVAPLFKAQQAGSFVHSIAPLGVSSRHPSYSAAKESAVRLSSTIAREMAPHRVRSNCVLLSETNSTFGTVCAPRGAPNVVPFPRPTDFKRLARLSGFLASEAAEGITAQVFEICDREISILSTAGLMTSDPASSERRDPNGCDQPSFFDANFSTTESYFEAVAAWFNGIGRSCGGPRVGDVFYPALADPCGA